MPRGPRQPVDAAGNLILFAAMTATLVALSEAGSRGPSSPAVLAGGAVALALLPALVLVERRARNPVLDLRLFGARMLAFANLAAFCAALARSALILLAALYFQAARGVDALTAGVAVLPVPIGMALASPAAGALGRRVPAYWISVGGALTSAAGLLILMLGAGPGTPYAVLAAGLFLCGCGSGAFLTGNTTQVMSALPPGSMGVVNGFRLMVMNVGIVLSTALTLSVLSGPVPADVRHLIYQGTLSRLSPAALDLLMTGFQRTYAVLFGVALAGAILAAMASTPHMRRSRPKEK
ncbi:MFS transporter [Thermocatellispora tengchongensis]|uniref:MFS transporter n=1 Tax=Thermocatellispora tengchongensis TaxID=1073253 RepID=UPI00364300D7